MGMVGEGVEDEDVAALPFDAGVDRVQGWHYARAMPLATLLDWCSQRRAQLSGVG
jgi:sensor c-di-GMP phosphodiesterase-like protein